MPAPDRSHPRFDPSKISFEGAPLPKVYPPIEMQAGILKAFLDHVFQKGESAAFTIIRPPLPAKSTHHVFDNFNWRLGYSQQNRAKKENTLEYFKNKKHITTWAKELLSLSPFLPWNEDCAASYKVLLFYSMKEALRLGAKEAAVHMGMEYMDAASISISSLDSPIQSEQRNSQRREAAAVSSFLRNFFLKEHPALSLGFRYGIELLKYYREEDKRVKGQDLKNALLLELQGELPIRLRADGEKELSFARKWLSAAPVPKARARKKS